MNVGGTTYTNADGTVYRSDAYVSGGKKSSSNLSIKGTQDDYLYNTNRYGNMSFDIPVAKGTYSVTLQFAETYWTNAGSRIFDVYIENGLVLDNFDIVKTVGGMRIACDRTFQAKVNDSHLNIDFVTVRDNAQVNAIIVRAVSSSGASASSNSSGTSGASNNNVVPVSTSTGGGGSVPDVNTGSTSNGGGAITEDSLLQGLIAYWKFDEPRGHLALDSTGNANDAILENGASFTRTSQSGRALLLRGFDDYADAGTIDVRGSAVTVTCWLYAYGTPEDDACLISQASGTGEQDSYFMLGTADGPSGTTLRFRLKTNRQGTQTLTADSGSITARKWYRATAVYDGANMALYLNGLKIGTVAKTGSMVAAGNVGCWIGNSPSSGYSRGFNGIIDDLRVYDRALTTAEVQALP